MLFSGQFQHNHEKMSLKMFDYIISSEPDVREIFKEFDLFNDKDVGFIKEAIAGPIYNPVTSEYICRGPDQAFLYEVFISKSKL